MKQEYSYLHFPQRVWVGNSSHECTKSEYQYRLKQDHKAHMYHLENVELLAKNDTTAVSRRNLAELQSDMIYQRNRVIEFRAAGIKLPKT